MTFYILRQSIKSVCESVCVRTVKLSRSAEIKIPPPAACVVSEPCFSIHVKYCSAFFSSNLAYLKLLECSFVGTKSVMIVSGCVWCIK